MKEKEILEISSREDIIRYCEDNDIQEELFNEPVKIKPGAECAHLFENLPYFNQPIVIPNTVHDCTCMFQYCRSFNSPVIFEEGNNNQLYLKFMFCGCIDFNQPIIFPKTVCNFEGMFFNCYKFNQPIYIKLDEILNDDDDDFIDSVITFEQMFDHCFNLNSPVIFNIKRDVEYIIFNNIFNNCYKFNSKVIFNINSNAKIYFNSSFAECVSFNQSIDFPDNIVSMKYMFSGCRSFNQPISLESNLSLKYLNHTFDKCIKFNSIILLPIIESGVLELDNMLADCHSFNKEIKNLLNMACKIEGGHLFYDCESLEYESLNVTPEEFNKFINTCLISKAMFYNCKKFIPPFIVKIKNKYSHSWSCCFAYTNIKFTIEDDDKIGFMEKIYQFSDISEFSINRFLDCIKIRINGETYNGISIKGIRLKSANYIMIYDSSKKLLEVSTKIDERKLAEALIKNLVSE